MNINIKVIVGFLLLVCSGCYSLPLWIPACSHKNQPIYEFKDLADGHHFIFNNNSKLAASVDVKDGILQGKFEIYYDTGILKFWGMLDENGHVVSGRHNTYASKLDDYYIRNMTVADEQNAQTELYLIVKNGVRNLVDIEESISSQMESPSEAKEPSLLDCARLDVRPKIGSVYKHDGKGLIVFQVIDGAVMVEAGFGFTVIVETKMPYVDDELLASGRYEYVGPYTYETIERKMRTIRRFKQVE